MFTKVYVSNITKDTKTPGGPGLWLHHLVCDCTVEDGETEKQAYRIFNEQEYADVMSKGYYTVPDSEEDEEDETENGSWQAICKCRLCGEIFSYNHPVYRKEWVFDDLDNIIDGKEAESTDQVRLLNTHDCKGIFKGSYGLADFLGYKKIE